MPTVGYESDDGGAVAVVIGSGLRLDRPMLLHVGPQGAAAEGGVQAGVEVLVSPVVVVSLGL